MNKFTSHKLGCFGVCVSTFSDAKSGRITGASNMILLNQQNFAEYKNVV